MAEASSDTKIENPTMPAESPSSRSGLWERAFRLYQLRMQILVVLCCMSWGLTLGVVFWRPPAPATVQPAPDGIANSTLTSISEASDAPSDATEKTHENHLTTRHLHLIDVMLTHGNVAQAMDAYARLRPSPGTLLHDQLTYRIALARETLQQTEAAGDIYQQLALQTKDAHMALAARLGQVRVWLRSGRPELARSVVARSSLDLNKSEAASRMHGELAHLFALTLLPDPPAGDDSYLSDDRVVPSTPRWTSTELLELAEHDEPSNSNDDETADTTAPPDEVAPALEVIYRYGNHPAETQLQIEQPTQSAKKLVDTIAEASELNLDWSPAARNSLTGRSIHFSAPSISVAVALDQLLCSFELIWDWQSDRVVIQTWGEADREQRQSFLRESSARQLRHAITIHPDHPLAQYSFLALGNLDFYDNEWANAISVYDQFENQFPTSVDIVFAQFNAAKSLLSLNRRDESLEKFFLVADGAHGHPLQSPANAYAGRLFLEQGRIEDAIRPLMRAVSTAPNSSRRVIPAITLASAYLMAGNSHAATQVLMEERHNIVREVDVATADFLGSYARFLVAKNDWDRMHEGKTLIRSLGNLKVERCFGAHLCLLAGDGFRELGFTPQMAELYQSSLVTNLPRWVRHEVQMRLVAYYVDSGDDSAARELLQQVVDDSDEMDHGGPPTFRWQAMLQLARIDLNAERRDSCLRTCRDLLKTQPESSVVQEALKLMGQAYERQGDHYQAAICFAGMLPESTPVVGPGTRRAVD